MKTDKANVLMVDDNADALDLYEMALSDLGANLLRASSGEEALALAKEHEFAAIILDIQMPGIDGYETAVRLRNIDTAKQTPIIFVTGNYRDEQSAARGYAVGASDYLVKPVRIETLRGKVSAYVDLYRRARTVVEKMRETLPPAADKMLVVHPQLASQFKPHDWRKNLSVEVLSASSGQEALNLLNQHEIALILLAASLPDMDSFEIIKFIRENDRFSLAPIMLIAQPSQPEADLKRGYALGVVDILTLPLQMDLLQAKARALLNQFRQIRALKKQFHDIDRLKKEIETTRQRLLDIEGELDRLGGKPI